MRGSIFADSCMLSLRIVMYSHEFKWMYTMATDNTMHLSGLADVGYQIVPCHHGWLDIIHLSLTCSISHLTHWIMHVYPWRSLGGLMWWYVCVSECWPIKGWNHLYSYRWYIYVVRSLWWTASVWSYWDGVWPMYVGAHSLTHSHSLSLSLSHPSLPFSSDDHVGHQASCSQSDYAWTEGASRVQLSTHCGVFWQLLCQQWNIHMHATHGKLHVHACTCTSACMYMYVRKNHINTACCTVHGSS